MVPRYTTTSTMTGNRSKQDQIVLVNIGKHEGFGVHRRSDFTTIPRNSILLRGAIVNRTKYC